MLFQRLSQRNQFSSSLLDHCRSSTTALFWTRRRTQKSGSGTLRRPSGTAGAETSSSSKSRLNYTAARAKRPPTFRPPFPSPSPISPGSSSKIPTISISPPSPKTLTNETSRTKYRDRPGRPHPKIPPRAGSRLRLRWPSGTNRSVRQGIQNRSSLLPREAPMLRGLRFKRRCLLTGIHRQDELLPISRRRPAPPP